VSASDFYHTNTTLRTRFYLNLTTNASQWEYPGPPQLPQPQQPFYPAPDASAFQSPPLQSPPLEQRQNIAAQEVPPPAGGDKGLGKIGGGLLGVAGGLLAGALVAHEVDEHKEKHHFWTDGSKPMGAGLLASMGSRLPFGNTSAAPQQSQGLGSFLPFGGGNAPRLNIHCAVWCDQDVTPAVRRMVKPDQTLEIDTGSLINHFGDPWPNNAKQFSILYSYGQRPWELAASGQNRGTWCLLPHQPLDKERMAFVQTDPRSRILAVVWGFGNGLEGGKGKIEKLKEIETTGEFPATNDWMGFDGWCGPAKTSVVYYRTGHGGIGVACAREPGTCRLPWNPLARWT